MSASACPTLVECPSDLPDPRVARTRLHNLMDILVIAICAVLCGAEGWDDMAAFGTAKRAWLQARPDLPHGIPSADTFRRVFARLEPAALQACFRAWTQTLHQLTQGDLLTLDVDDLCWGNMQQQWKGLCSLARVTCTRHISDKSSEEACYFISSLPHDAAQVLRAVRQHRGIENRLHYVLDVSLREDACRIRKDNGAENRAVLRHIALNLLRQEKTCERGIKARQKKAGWDNAYLEQVLIS